MTKGFFKIAIAFLTIFIFFNLNKPAYAASDSMLEISEVRSTSEKAVVPVILHDTKYLTSGYFTISLPDGAQGVSIKSFIPSDLFDDDVFRTTGNQNRGQITVNFISQTKEYVRLKDYNADDELVIGYINLNLSKDFVPGQSASLQAANVFLTEKDNKGLDLDVLPGKISHRMPIGVISGENEVTPAGAMRVLQHVQGDLITEREQFLSLDVNADGLLTQTDAQQILDYATGVRTTFLAIEAKELNNAVLNSEYYEKVEARHGRAPYTFKKSGTLPSGLKLNEETGEIIGTPSRVKEYTFTIKVTDAVGNEAERKFTINVIDSSIKSVEKLSPINVKLRETPQLPTRVAVTYEDKTTGTENVKWEPVDTSVLGTITAKGTIGSTGFIITVPIHVVDKNYVNNTVVDYFELLNIYTVVIDTTSDVYAVTVNNIPTHYEGNNQFSLASISFIKGSTVTIRLYDKYGNLIETKKHKLEVN